MKEKIPQIRPHHGMCLAFFEGKGYSDVFTSHMQEMLEYVQKDPKVMLVLHTDEICSVCPNNQNGICKTEEKVQRYDRSVLDTTGLSEGEKLSFSVFAAKVQKMIIETGLRESICGDCQWNSVCVKNANGMPTCQRGRFLLSCFL